MAWKWRNKSASISANIINGSYVENYLVNYQWNILISMKIWRNLRAIKILSIQKWLMTKYWSSAMTKYSWLSINTSSYWKASYYSQLNLADWPAWNSLAQPASAMQWNGNRKWRSRNISAAGYSAGYNVSHPACLQWLFSYIYSLFGNPENNVAQWKLAENGYYSGFSVMAAQLISHLKAMKLINI
jgi:hypothetical protein